MKEIKKIAALLLAGVLMLTMLTACGGGGGGGTSFAQQVENTVTAAYREATDVNCADATLKQLAAGSLGYIRNGRYYYEDLKKTMTVEVDGSRPNKAIIRFAFPMPDPYAPASEQSFKVLDVTPDMLANLKNQLGNLGTMDDVIAEVENEGGRLEAIGVSAKTINGKTYFAIGMAMSIDSSALSSVSLAMN